MAWKLDPLPDPRMAIGSGDITNDHARQKRSRGVLSFKIGREMAGRVGFKKTPPPVLSGSYRARSAFPVAAVYDRRKLPPAFTGSRLKKSLLTTKFLNK